MPCYRCCQESVQGKLGSGSCFTGQIEKAALSLCRLLLGVLDKATLNLGDNSTVNFENSLILLTSNVGAKEMYGEIRPEFGYRSVLPQSEDVLASKLERIGLSAIRRRFAPEFVNRIDAFITYDPNIRPLIGGVECGR